MQIEWAMMDRGGGLEFPPLVQLSQGVLQIHLIALRHGEVGG